MNLRNCQQCGKPYLYAGVPLCPACLQEDEDAFAKVYSHLRLHPGQSPEEVSQATGVELARIMRFLREGRLQGSGAGLTCQRCGAPIESGRLCTRCATALAKALGASSAVEPTHTEARESLPRGTGYYSKRPAGDKRV